MLIKDLEQFGFSKNMADIYLSMFNKAETKAGEVIRSTGLHRNIVYTGLQKLEEKKLITKTNKRGVAIYKVLDPERLLGELDNKKKLAQHIIEELKLKQPVNAQEIIVHEGIEEVIKNEVSIYERAKEGETFRYIGLSPHWWQIMDDRVQQKIITLQNRKKIQFRALSGYIGEKETYYAEKTNGLTTIKVVPSITSRESETIITDDRVIIKTFLEPYTVIEIVNPNVAKVYREHFDALWNQEAQTYVGWNQLHTLYYEKLLPSLKSGDTKYVIGAGYGEKKNNKKIVDFYTEFNNLTIEKGINKKLLFYERFKDTVKEASSKLVNANPESFAVRYLPDSYYTPVEIHISPVYVFVLVWGDEPVATLYENKAVRDSFKKQFDLLWNQNTKTYIGEEGARAYIMESLKYDDMYWIGGNGGIEKFHPKVWDEYKKLRVKHKVYWHDLMDPRGTLSSTDKKNKHAGEEQFYEFKFLPEAVAGPHVIGIYGNKVANIIWKEESVITVIDDKDIADSYKKYWKYLWDQETKTYTGYEEVQRILMAVASESVKNGVEDNYCIGGSFDSEDNKKQIEEFYKKVNKHRIKIGLHSYILFYEQHKKEAFVQINESGDSDLMQTSPRFLPKEHYSPLQINIFGNKTVIIVWEDKPTAILYENPQITKSFIQQFKLLWGIASE